MSSLEADAALAAELVRAAGSLAHRMRSSGVDARQKTSVSDIVTHADEAAETLIAQRLADERPDDGLVGEEGAARPSRNGRTWMIDPIDGTWNYAAGLSWWCSAVALLDDGDVVLGAVYHPREDVLFLGGPDRPSTRNGVPLPPLQDRSLAESCLVTYLHPPFYEGEVGAAFARVVRGAATLRMLGSGTMDQMALAQGQMGVLTQHSVAPWDWWPGSAIVRGVGGAARRITAAGVEWSVAGAPTAVAEVADALEDR